MSYLIPFTIPLNGNIMESYREHVRLTFPSDTTLFCFCSFGLFVFFRGEKVVKLVAKKKLFFESS